MRVPHLPGAVDSGVGFGLGKQVHPDIGISGKALGIMNSFINDIFKNLAGEASKLARSPPSPLARSRLPSGWCFWEARQARRLEDDHAVSKIWFWYSSREDNGAEGPWGDGGEKREEMVARRWCRGLRV
ncbi:hypothetical protein Scep_023708 [Stephania cephalantha]|uniref:Uncharacterized protein n=1 Tax=Stephania cephalantha TaxID=152367 RepID=A0AAP0F0L3_9MAGN